MNTDTTVYEDFKKYTLGDAQWMAHITHAVWDVKDATLTFRLPTSSNPCEGYHTLAIEDVEKDYPLLRQALRVANVTCRTNRARGDALAKWSSLINGTITAPLFLFKKSDGTSTALGLAWAKRLRHVDLVDRGIDFHVAVADANPVGASKTAHPAINFGQRIANANFPGLTKAVRRSLDLGMSSSETADYVKREIIEKSPDQPVALPEIQV